MLKLKICEDRDRPGWTGILLENGDWLFRPSINACLAGKSRGKPLEPEPRV